MCDFLVRHLQVYCFGFTCLPGSHLEINAAVQANELAFVNDFRRDTSYQNYANPAKQQGWRPNVAMVVVWLATEELPRLLFVCIAAVNAGEELLVDYGEKFWQQYNKDEHNSARGMRKYRLCHDNTWSALLCVWSQHQKSIDQVHEIQYRS